MEPAPDIRWKQRFQNFGRAYVLLRDALANGPDALNQLEKEGAIQVLKEAFAAKLLDDGQVRIDMLSHRNILSHTYKPVSLDKALVAIHDRYVSALTQLHDRLQREVSA